MRAFVMVVAWLLAVMSVPAIEQPRAADYAPPSLTAWQRLHEGHLTIEWAETARVQQERSGNRLILRFATPLGVRIGPALRNISNFIDSDRTTVEGKDLSLVLKPGVVPKVKVREQRIVTVDFFRDPARRSRARIEATMTEGGLRLTLDWPGPTRIKADQNIRDFELQIFPSWDLDPSELANLQRKLKPWFHDLQSQSEQNRTKLSFVLEPQILSSIRPEGATRTVIDFFRDASTFPEPAAGPIRQAFKPKKRPTRLQNSAENQLTAPPIPKKRPASETEPSPIAQVDERNARADDASERLPEALTIKWNKPVGAAVFVRAGHLWVVFDEENDELLAGLPASPAVFGPGSLVPADGGTALRFPLRETVDVDVSRTPDGSWEIDPIASPETRAVSIERVDGSSALRVTPAPGERIVRIIDPAVGDQIDVLPLRDSGLSLPRRRRFVDLELLPTAQGLAWRPLSDRLAASLDEQGLELGSPEGLSLSTIGVDDPKSSKRPILEAMARREVESSPSSDMPIERPAIKPIEVDGDQLEDSQNPLSYFDLAGSGVERPLVSEYRRIRRQAISKAPPEDRDRARLDLARLLVSERLATEARTVLNTISDDAAKNVILQKQALGGVSAFLIGQLTEASTLLLDPGLNGDDEIDVWRAALHSAEDQWPNAAERWQAASDVLDVYPPRLKLDLGLMALQAAIETDDAEMMKKGIRRLASLPLNPYDRARFDAMKALKAERTGDLERARALLTDLTNSPNPAIRTLADFQLAAIGLGTSNGDPAMLRAFDRRLPLWRGHPQERAMLDRLARQYKDANALREALTTWRRLVHLFPEEAENEDLTRARRDTFVQALTDAIEPAKEPLEVYAIYLDFIGLVPDDPEARDVHLQLARHLTDLDLVNEAINVLLPLMTSTDDGLERLGLGAEIAGLMLQQDRAKQALSVLDGTEASRVALSPVLNEERRMIRARALARLGNADDALRVLRDMKSDGAQRLRAKIFWDERRWPRLAAVVESYFTELDLTATLTDDDQELVLWLAMARQQEKNSEQLNAIRERFGAAMQNGLYAEAFDLATQSTVRTNDISAFLDATESQLAELRRFREATATLP